MRKKLLKLFLPVLVCACLCWGCGSLPKGQDGGADGTAGEPRVVGQTRNPSEPGDGASRDLAASAGSGDGVKGDSAASAGSGDGAKGDSAASAGSGDGASGNPATSVEPEPEPQVTLVMVGDILLHTPLAKSGELEDGSYDFDALFANTRDEISGADLALVNQEVILGGAELGVSGYPRFNAPYELGDALSDAGFDVILHATNHALDKGQKGLLNCLAFWEGHYPEKAVLGIHDSREDSEEIYVYEQDGIRIAVLNYTYGTNGIALPKDMPYAVDLLDRERVAADLARAEELADFTVVCPHWGTEYKLTQSGEQEKWAVFFAENGADLIIGTHPHVIEPVYWMARDAEGNWVQAKADAGQDGPEDGVLVYYSLGNFCNWTSGAKKGVANRMVGGMAQVTVGRNEAGEAYVADWDVMPLVCHLEKGFGGVTVYPLEEYTEGLAERNEIVKQDDSFSLDHCLDLVEEVFGRVMGN